MPGAVPSWVPPVVPGLSGPESLCLLLPVSPEKSLEQELASPILDIEDLVRSGTRHR